jgi:ribosomal protein S19E (S16A)
MNEAHEHAVQLLRRHSMAQRQMAITQRHAAALSALKVYPGHLPLDGLCLDELAEMGLIRAVKDGYRLTPRGEESLDAAVIVLRAKPNFS